MLKGCSIPISNHFHQRGRLSYFSPKLKAKGKEYSKRIPAYKSPRVIFNVSGMRYETYEETLANYPNTLLGSRMQRMKFYDPVNDEFFIPRNKYSFAAVLFFYQSGGILSRPADVSEDIFTQDINFYGLENYVKRSDDLYKLVSFDEDNTMPDSPIKRILWRCFEQPRSSRFSRALALLSITVIILSTIVFCIETFPELHSPHLNEVWFTTETSCIAWFTFEYLVRIFAAPDTWKFVRSPIGIIDVIAILPFFITLALEESTVAVRSFVVLRALRLFRVLRVFKLSRYSTEIRVLLLTLYTSSGQLKTLFFCFSIATIVFSSAIYYAEIDNPHSFSSIPASFWWSVITMTSVGYGDVTPKTIPGKLIATFCALSGIVLFCLPTPVLVSTFIKYYIRKEEVDPRRKKFANNLKKLFLQQRGD